MKEDILWQLDKLIGEWQSIVKQRATIKNWCLTLWVALLVAVSTNKLQISELGSYLILIMPVMLFWFLESMYGAIAIHREKQIEELEDLLSTKGYENEIEKSIYFSTRYHQFTRKDSVKAFFRAFLREETVWFYYALLIFASIGFIALFGDGGYLNIIPQGFIYNVT